jgi:hypothetical protein
MSKLNRDARNFAKPRNYTRLLNRDLLMGSVCQRNRGALCPLCLLITRSQANESTPVVGGLSNGCTFRPAQLSSGYQVAGSQRGRSMDSLDRVHSCARLDATLQYPLPHITVFPSRCGLPFSPIIQTVYFALGTMLVQFVASGRAPDITCPD